MAVDDQTPTPAEQARALARTWARAVAHCCFVPMRVAEVEELLCALGGQLLAAAAADPPDPEPARRAGGALVNAHLTDPAVLETTLAVLGANLPPGPGLATVQAAFGAGYTRALRDRTLLEQERLARAMIEAQHQAERAARDSEARFRAIFAGAALGVAIFDLRGRIVEVNQTFADLLGYTTEEMRAMVLPDLRHPQDPPDARENYARMTRGELDHLRMEKGYFRRDGTEVWVDVAVSLVRDDTGRPDFAVAMVNDVTERHQLAARLRHMALHDPLTGLPNRTLFTDRLTTTTSQAGTARLGVCYLDLDGFKQLNDRLGHDVGDQVLVAVAARLGAYAGKQGHLAARMGGDEFVVLVEGSTGLAQLTELAEGILAGFSQPVRVGPHRLRITASVGVVERPAAGADPAEILKAADVALYQAKGKGRGRWALHDEARLTEQVARYALAAALPDALDRAEFRVVYQPIVTLPDLAPRGVEALVRWRHPLLGELTPDRFIDLAEETGLIIPLGRFVLREACRQVAAWQERFPATDLFASVNVAAAQTQEVSFVEDVETILAETGLKPSRLQLELTESTLMTTSGAPLETLRSLADTGVRVAIDDFGTGYSSLAYLRTLPVHALKLAGPFVSGLDRPDPRSRTDDQIVDALVRLAHAIDLTVTAEGVETATQAARLGALGCDYLQGWYSGRPCHPDRLATLLESAAGP